MTKLGGKFTQYGWIVLLVLGLALQLYFLYFGYLYNHYIVSPGNDVVSHYLLIQQILTTHAISPTYPPLFHLIVIGLSRLFHIEPFHILTYWTPMMAVFPALAMYFLLRQLFETRVSVITTLILLLTSGYPIYAFVDGNYPDMLAYGVFAVLAFAFILRYFRTHKARNLIYATIFLLLIALTHHFTFFNILGILIIFGLVQVYLLITRSQIKWRAKSILSAIIILSIFVLSLFLAGKLYGTIIHQFLNNLIQNRSIISDNYLNQPNDFVEYTKSVGNIIWYAGLFGLFFVTITSFTRPEEKRAKQLVIIWFLFLYILSRLGASGFPARFMRELALPLTVCLGFLLNHILNSDLIKKRLGLVLGYGLIGYLIIMNSALYAGLNKLPNAFDGMIQFWSEDQAKLDYLAQNVPADTVVLYNPNANAFTQVKSVHTLRPLTLTASQKEVATAYLVSGDKNAKKDYLALRKGFLVQYKGSYILDDVKPPSNPSGVIYPFYANFEFNKVVLGELAYFSRVVKKFPDGAVLYQVK